MQYAHITRELDGPMRGGDSWAGPLVGLIFLIVFTGLVIYVVRSLTSTNNTQTEVRDPLDIAKERYAKGEITKEELAEIRKELS